MYEGPPDPEVPWALQGLNLALSINKCILYLPRVQFNPFAAMNVSTTSKSARLHVNKLLDFMSILLAAGYLINVIQAVKATQSLLNALKYTDSLPQCVPGSPVTSRCWGPF